MDLANMTSETVVWRTIRMPAPSAADQPVSTYSPVCSPRLDGRRLHEGRTAVRVAGIAFDKAIVGR